MKVSRTTRFIAAALTLCAAATTQAQVVDSWDYRMSSTWKNWNFIEGGGFQNNVAYGANSVIEWGVEQYMSQGLQYHTADHNAHPNSSRSGIAFVSSFQPSTRPEYGWGQFNMTGGYASGSGTLANAGDYILTNAIAYYNSDLSLTSKILTSVDFTQDVYIKPSDADRDSWLNISSGSTLHHMTVQEHGGNVTIDFAPITGSFEYNGYLYDYTWGIMGVFGIVEPYGNAYDIATTTNGSITSFITAENSNAYIAFGLRLDNVTPMPVPEPETYSMLLAGLAVVGTVARRRRQAQRRG